MNNKLKYTLPMFVTVAVVISAVIMIKSDHSDSRLPYVNDMPTTHVGVTGTHQEDADILEAIRRSQEDERARLAQERLEREQLRREQDDAYQRSLAADQEKDRVAAEKAAADKAAADKAAADKAAADKQAEEDERNRLTPEQIREKRLAYFGL